MPEALRYPINDTDDRTEQLRITSAFWAAVPTGTYYHNIIAAAADILSQAAYGMVRGHLRYPKKREYVGEGTKEKDRGRDSAH